MLQYNSLQCINAVLSEPNLKPHLPATKWPTVVEKVIKMLNGITSLGDIKETNTNVSNYASSPSCVNISLLYSHCIV